MLTLSYKKGETFTLIHPDGTQMHAHIQSITDGYVRIVWSVPDTVKISRDTVGAKRAYELVNA